MDPSPREFFSESLSHDSSRIQFGLEKTNPFAQNAKRVGHTEVISPWDFSPQKLSSFPTP